MTSSPGPLASPFDVLVVGGGPAGLAAAVALTRSLRSVLVVDAGQPRNAPAAGVHNYLGREGAAPAELLADGRAAVAAYGGRVEPGEVVALERLGQEAGQAWFRGTLADGRFVDARRIVVATGLVDELPAIPGLAERWGRDVLHCPYCHGYEARGTTIGILSTTPMTAHQALLFRQLSADITVLTHTGPAVSAEDRERLEARGVRIVDGAVLEVLTTEDALSGVRLASGTVVDLQNLAIAAPAVAHSRLLADLGVEVADFTVGDAVLGSYALAEPTGATSVPGLYAAGNVATIQAQVSTSAAAGLGVGALVNAALIEEETTQAVAERRRTEEFWEDRYRRRPDLRSDHPEGHDEGHGDGHGEGHGHGAGRPNPVLLEVASTLTPGTALDLGSGHGDDAVWLGRQGWRVTGIDVSRTVIEHAEGAAAAAGVADRVSFERHDLATSFPRGTFDLVTSHYLHSPTGLPRSEVLRRAAAAVAPGGTLLVVGHSSLPPWAWRDLDGRGVGASRAPASGSQRGARGVVPPHDTASALPTPETVLDELNLGEDWETLRVEVAPRAVTGPGGEQASMDDGIVLVRRRADPQSTESSASSSRSTSSSVV